MLHTVRISEMGLFLRCPRLVYIEGLRPLRMKARLQSLILRETALSISQEGDIDEGLLSSLLKACEEIPLVYGAKPCEVESALDAVIGLLPAMASGYAPWLSRLLPCDIDVDLRSDKLHLSGRLDRLAPGKMPSLIRPGAAPEEGVWKGDRLRLAGYALMIEEIHGVRIDGGFVEYPRSGVVREASIRSIDRSRALRIRDRVMQIKDGRMPERPEGARCEICLEREMCCVRTTLASNLF